MAGHYSSKCFFRQMPNALLARYFHRRKLFGGLNFAYTKEGKSDELLWPGLLCMTIRAMGWMRSCGISSR